MSSTYTKCGILTVSDSCFSGDNLDLAGPKLSEAVLKAFPHFQIVKALVPDDILQIAHCLNQWVLEGCHLILTTGGTGFASRDVTPEATKMVIQREAPGVTQTILIKSLEITPMAMLSRAVCGIKDQCLIVNFPGSPKGAVECFSFIQGILPHAIAVIQDDKTAISKCHPKHTPILSSNVNTEDIAGRPRVSSYPMLEVQDAKNLIIESLPEATETEEIRLEDALNRVLAEEVTAPDAVPAFDASIKDGYAVRFQDGKNNRKIRTRVAAGDAPSDWPLGENEAVRINTGAPIPPGADAVVQVEDTEVTIQSNSEEVEIGILKEPSLGEDIRLKGSDIRKGAVVLKRGERLKSAFIGVLASIGKSKVIVYKRASVAILTTGNELKNHNEPIEPGQIRDSNRLSLLNLLQEYHYKCSDNGIVNDEPTAIKNAISKALQNHDILITTGGVSMGEFDYIKRVLELDFNATIHFGRVNMKPGKPTTFATLIFENKKKFVFGLPGNPVSASVTCLLFVVPLLRFWERSSIWQLPTVDYVVSTTKATTGIRPDYTRVVVKIINGKIVATPNGEGQTSSKLNSLVNANGLLLIPSGMVPKREYSTHIILLGDLQC